MVQKCEGLIDRVLWPISPRTPISNFLGGCSGSALPYTYKAEADRFSIYKGLWFRLLPKA